MVIENNNQKEQQDIVKQENGNENKENTIENVLQEKFQDPTKESFFMDIFEDSQIKNTYNQESIIKFIQGHKPINKFYRENQETEFKDKVKMISEEIDIFEKTNGNTTIINVSNILEDKVVQKEDKVVQKEDKVVQKEYKVVQKEDKVVQKEDINIKIEETKKQRKATKESYANLDKTKYPEPTTEEISKGKTQIKKDTQQKLEAQGLSIDEYARFLIFEQKYEKNLREEGKMEFLNNLKKLKEDLGEKTTLQKTIDPKNTDKIIDANKSLKNYTDNSNKFDKITTPYDSIQNTKIKLKISYQKIKIYQI